jgi:hypothetical protein
MPLHAAYDHDGSGRPLLTAEAADALADLQATLEARPAFIFEAAGDVDQDQLAAAVSAANGPTVLRLIRAAVTAKREREVAATLHRLSPRSSECEALAHLVRLYA